MFPRNNLVDATQVIYNSLYKIDLDAMREICMLGVLNFKIAKDKCPPSTWDQDKDEFKVGDMVLLINHAPTNAFHTKYKPSFRICKWISDNAADLQDSAWKVRHVSIQHLQLLHLADVLMHLPDMTSFGRTMKNISHPTLMPNLPNTASFTK